MSRWLPPLSPPPRVLEPADLPDLSPGEREALALLAEECAEVVQACAKVLRHGYGSRNPHRPDLGTNRTQLAVELGHVQAAAGLICRRLDIDDRLVRRAEVVKLKELPRWLHHQDAGIEAWLIRGGMS